MRWSDCHITAIGREEAGNSGAEAVATSAVILVCKSATANVVYDCECQSRRNTVTMTDRF
jgi:hypothetical protein